MVIQTDEGFADIVNDPDRLLETARQARITFLDQPADVPVWNPADVLTFLVALGFDVSGYWLGQQIRRGHIVPKLIGGVEFFGDGQVAGMVGKLWDQRRFAIGRFLWAKTEVEVEADAREVEAFAEIVRYLSETHDAEELRRRCAESLAESHREALSDEPGAAERQKAAENAALRYRAAQLMREGAFDNLDTLDGTEAEIGQDEHADAA